jgi:hypothetical protein
LYRHGAQGQLDEASKAVLENEFGTKNEDDVIKQILTKGQIQMSEVSPATSVFYLPETHLLTCSIRILPVAVTATSPPDRPSPTARAATLPKLASHNLRPADGRGEEKNDITHSDGVHFGRNHMNRIQRGSISKNE